MTHGQLFMGAAHRPAINHVALAVIIVVIQIVGFLQGVPVIANVILVVALLTK